MKKKDGLLCDFQNEKIEGQTLKNIVGGKDWKPTKDEDVGSNSASTEGDEGNCDVDDVYVCWSMDTITPGQGG